MVEVSKSSHSNTQTLWIWSYLEKRVFVGVIKGLKVRPPWNIQVALSLIIRDRKQRVWRGTPKSQGQWGHQRLEEARKDPPLMPPEGVWPHQRHLISDSWLPYLWESKFLLFQDTLFMIIVYRSLRTPIQEMISISRIARKKEGDSEELDFWDGFALSWIP